MSEKPENKPSVSIDVGAKATFEVKTEIPKESSGRLLDALTDIIRPISEARGLRADRIRLQREDVALEIARRAQRRIASEKIEPIPAPLKVLIPLFEKGSQESPADEFMIGLWANLLVSSVREGSVPPRFVAIIGEMSGAQARLIVKIAGEENRDLEMTAYGLQQQNVENKLSKILISKTVSVEDVYEGLKPEFLEPGAVLEDIIVWDDEGETYSIPTTEQKIKPLASGDIQILASLGLLQRVDIHREISGRSITSVSIHYFFITELGSAFLEAVMS